jgi:hypothetical protein
MNIIMFSHSTCEEVGLTVSAGLIFLGKTALKTVSFPFRRRKYVKIRIIEFRGHGGSFTGCLEDVVHWVKQQNGRFFFPSLLSPVFRLEDDF